MSRSSTLGGVHEVELSCGRIRYRERGSGEPLVFVHGLLVNGDLWRNVAPPLARDYRCIVPDWPLGSHDLGMKRDCDFSLPGLAAMVDEFLAALELERVTLVAGDTGGAIAQWVLTRHPERIERAVLTPCDAFDNFPPTVLLHLKWLGRFRPMVWVMGQSLRFRLIERLPLAFGWATLRPIDREALRSYAEPARSNAAARRDYAALARSMSWRDTQQASEELGRFERPVLLAWSRNDRLFPLAHGQRLARLLPAGELAVVEDSGPFIQEDRPEELTRLIRDFVVSSERGAAGVASPAG